MKRRNVETSTSRHSRLRLSAATIAPYVTPATADPSRAVSTFRHCEVAKFSDVTALPVDHTTASLTRDLVADDEVIILLLRPSLWFVVLSCFYNLIFIALITFALAYMAKFMSQLPGIGWTDGQAFGLGLGLVGIRVGWQFLEWLGRVYVLTDRRVIARSGVLRIGVFQTQLKHVQHTAVFASLRERLTGLGTIGFATAGSDTFESFWTNVRNPFAVHKIVVDAIERYGR